MPSGSPIGSSGGLQAGDWRREAGAGGQQADDDHLGMGMVLTSVASIEHARLQDRSLAQLAVRARVM